jgi:hypothetical protein
MLHRKFAFAMFVSAVYVFAVPAVATLPQRTFVAAAGNDLNPCSRVLPCRSFTAAILQTIAGGEVIVLDSAGYGPVAITGPIKIIAAPGIYAGISVSSGAGITVSAGTRDVILLQGLAINNVGGGTSGITVAGALRVAVDRCAIYGFDSTGVGLRLSGQSDIEVTDTIFLSDATGVELVNTGFFSHVTLNRVRIANAGTGGVHATGTNLLLTLIDTTITSTNVAVWVDPAPNNTIRFDIRRGELVLNQTAVLAQTFGAASTVIGTVADTLVSENPSAGIWADAAFVGTTVELDVTNCVIRHNGRGLLSGLGATIVFRNNLIVDNTFGIDGGALLTGLGNTLHNNGTPGAPTGTVAPL